MLVNESKHQGLVFGETDFSFSFPVQETLQIFGMEIDKKLNFQVLVIYLMCAKRSIINYMLCCDFENLFLGAPYSSFIRRTFYHISTIAPLSGIFVAHAMRRSLKH